jgi:hypothetical protein
MPKWSRPSLLRLSTGSDSDRDFDDDWTSEPTTLMTWWLLNVASDFG